MVINQLKAWLVEFGSCVGLCNCKTDGVCKTLTEGTRSDFDTRRILTFGMARSDAVYCLERGVESAATEEIIGIKTQKTYSESFQIVQRHLVAEKM